MNQFIKTHSLTVNALNLTTLRTFHILKNNKTGLKTFKLYLSLLVPRYENNLFDWDFDVELGNTEEFIRDDPGTASHFIHKTDKKRQ